MTAIFTGGTPFQAAFNGTGTLRSSARRRFSYFVLFDGCCPVGMPLVPADRVAQALGEGDGGPPTQLALELAPVQGVTAALGRSLPRTPAARRRAFGRR